jgi:hypothetical protein
LAAQVNHPNSNFYSEHFQLAPPARRARLACGLAGASAMPLHIFKTAKSFGELNRRDAKTRRETENKQGSSEHAAYFPLSSPRLCGET